MMLNSLHSLARRGDLSGVREALRQEAGRQALNRFDKRGFTPLMHAVMSPRAGTDLVRVLLDHGARTDQHSSGVAGPGQSLMVYALGAGDPEKVSVLLNAGADLHYRRAKGYDALIDAVHGRDVSRDTRLLDLLRLLIAQGVALNGVTGYAESGLRALSRIGRFDAVGLLLRAGADASHLGWTPLMHAVALGSLADVQRLVASGEWLEATDWWERTAWLLAVQAGSVAKAQYLEDHGADIDARGRCGAPPLFYAVQGHQPAMLQRLLDMGIDVEQSDEFGSTALFQAVEEADVECVEILLRAGADPNRECNGTVLGDARTREIAACLLDAGADPRHLSVEARRALLGFPPDPDEDLLDCSREEFHRGRTRRFGRANPEEMHVPFWSAMIRAGVTGYAGARYFQEPSSCQSTPVWCAQRFGQSLTFLPDGRMIQVAGEHEDSYDPDFCIYNDVFVHEPEGTIRIYGYPESLFPPTDFHTATLVGEFIYVIGSLGYQGARCYGETQIFRLDTTGFRMERVKSSGDMPGWLYEHRAILRGSGEIEVSLGTIVTFRNGKEVHEKNEEIFILDTRTMTWRKVRSTRADS